MNRVRVWLKISLAIIILSTSALKAADNARIEESGACLDYILYDCEIKGNKAVEKLSRKLTIVNQRGDRFNYLVLNKQPSTVLKKLEVKVFDSAGVEVYSRKAKDMVKTKGFGAPYAIYDDLKTYQTECRAPSYPYTVEYEHELEYHTLFFWRGTSVQERIPVDSFEYRLSVENDFVFNYEAAELLGEPEISQDKKKKSFIWRAVNIPPYDPDDFAAMDRRPAELKFVPGHFNFEQSEFSGISWKNIGTWYRDLAADRYTADTTHSPADDSLAFRPLLKKLYEKVLDETRYVLISIGISGWQPAKAADTRACGYGDCKGLSTLLISDIKACGIEVYPALILTRQNGAVNPEFPEFGFNHVITAAVDGADTVWMDATCRDCPFGDIPWMDEDTYCLLVTDSGGVLVRTPASAPEENTVFNAARLRVTDDGSCELSSRVTLTGNFAAMVRSRYGYMDRDEINEFVKKLLLPEEGAEYTLDNFEVENLGDNDAPLLFRLEGRSKRPCHEVNGVRYIKPPILKPGKIDIDDNTRSVDLRYPKTVRDSIVITFATAPPSGEITAPDSARCEYPHGTMTAVYAVDSAAVTAVFERSGDAYFISGENVGKYKDFLGVVNRIADRHVKIRLAADE